MNTKPHTDIKSDGWINRVFPSSLRPYATLARLDRPVGIWLLLLPGWWAIALASGGIGSMKLEDWRFAALFAAGAVIMRGAGCVINDLWDRKLDKQVERTRARPLASGAVSPRQAMVFLGGLLLAGLAVLLQMNPVTVMLGFLVMPLIIAYPLMKRLTWWPQAFLGLTFNFGALMGWSAVIGVIGLPALCLYAAGICWTLGYDTIYAHQDKEDDLIAGIKSTALKFGANSKKWVAGFYGAAMALLTAALFTGAGGAGAWMIFVPVMGAHLAWQIKNWRPDSPDSSLKTFRSNRDFGLIVLAAALFS